MRVYIKITDGIVDTACVDGAPADLIIFDEDALNDGSITAGAGGDDGYRQIGAQPMSTAELDEVIEDDIGGIADPAAVAAFRAYLAAVGLPRTKYCVALSRRQVVVDVAEIEVEATSPQEAEEKAIDIADEGTARWRNVKILEDDQQTDDVRRLDTPEAVIGPQELAVEIDKLLEGKPANLVLSALAISMAEVVLNTAADQADPGKFESESRQLGLHLAKVARALRDTYHFSKERDATLAKEANLDGSESSAVGADHEDVMARGRGALTVNDMALFNTPLSDQEQPLLARYTEFAVRLRRLALFGRLIVSEDVDGKPLITAQTVSTSAEGKAIIWFANDDREQEG